MLVLDHIHCISNAIIKLAFFLHMDRLHTRYPTHFYLIDIFLQLININILLRTSISLIFELSLLGSLQDHHILQRMILNVDLDPSLCNACNKFTLNPT